MWTGHQSAAKRRSHRNPTEPQHTPRVVPHDPDDDHVVAAAVKAQAHLIVSGDKHLLQLKESISIPVLKAGQALQLIGGGLRLQFAAMKSVQRGGHKL